MSARPWPQFDSDLLLVVEAWRARAYPKPVLRYTCDHSGPGRRGSCTLLEVWARLSEKLLYFPAYRVTQEEHDRRQADLPREIRGGMEGRHYAARVDLVLNYPVTVKEYVQSNGLSCRHRVADLDLNQLFRDVANKVPHRTIGPHGATR